MGYATFTSTMPSASADYIRHLWSNPVKTDKINQSELLDFKLAAGYPGFVKLTRGAYIKIFTDTYGYWFTGYVTNDPELEYLGIKNKVPAWGYKYEASADEYILSLKPIGLVHPFMNVYMGDIIKRLAEYLAPGVFNTTNVQNGPLLAQFTIDPNMKFNEVVSKLCESAHYVLYSRDHSLYFLPQDDNSFSNITLDGNDKHFTPGRLQIRPSTAPVINDVTVFGDIEPQKYMTEYFIGTGLQGTFPLASNVYGVEKSVLLEESFSGNSISSTLWETNDNGSTLVVDNGYLNIIGGSSYLASQNAIPLEGNIRLTHGEWDFLSGSGVICALYRATPTSGVGNCVYGLNVSGTSISPIVNGTTDSTQSFTLSTTKRYVFRTLAEFTRTHRLSQPYAYIDANGKVNTVGGGAVETEVNWHTIITEVDPETGKLTKQHTFNNNDITLSSNTVFAVYVPVVSSGLHATVSNITISIPVNATLSIASKAAFKNLNFDDWSSTWVPAGWDEYQNVEKETQWMDGELYGCRMYTHPDEPKNRVYLSQIAADKILPNSKYHVRARIRRNPSLTSGTLTIKLIGTDVEKSLANQDSIPSTFETNDVYLAAFLRAAAQTAASASGSTSTTTTPDTIVQLDEPGVSLDITTIGDSFQTVEGILTNGISTIPQDLKLLIELTDGSVDQYGAMWIDNVEIYTDFEPKLIGPNEIDAMDGLAPYATIVASNSGAPVKDPIFGNSTYNQGQCQLVFFKDSVNRVSTTPTEGTVIRLTYRSAGWSVGRVISANSVATEAAIWGDDGYRSSYRKDIIPRPRTSYECELAAYALVSENVYKHFEGTYTQFSTYFDTEPRAGGIFQMENIPGIAATFAAEQITEVKTTFECEKSSLSLFLHEISFSNPQLQLKKLLSVISSSTEFLSNSGSNINPPPIDLSQVGIYYRDDVTKPRLVSWNNQTLNFDVGIVQAPAEVRLTNSGWGQGTAKNLLSTSSGRFSYNLEKASRSNSFFLRQV